MNCLKLNMLVHEREKGKLLIFYRMQFFPSQQMRWLWWRISRCSGESDTLLWLYLSITSYIIQSVWAPLGPHHWPCIHRVSSSRQGDPFTILPLFLLVSKNNKVLGLSKLARIVEMFCRRLQVLQSREMGRRPSLRCKSGWPGRLRMQCGRQSNQRELALSSEQVTCAWWV